MLKAINSWSFGGMDIKPAMRLAKEAGFDAIELALNETGELGLDCSDAEINDIKTYARQIGLPIHSVACGLYWEASFSSDDASEREKAARIGEKQIRLAAALGADAVLIIPGMVGVDFLPNKAVVPYDIAYHRALNAMLSLKKVAEAYQIHIGIENVWNKFLVSPLEMRDFIDRIDSPYVGAYLDVGNILYNGYPEHWIAILGDRIKKVHFKDYRRACGGLSGFVDLLAGDADWPAIMRAFSQVGYDGAVTAEMIPPYRHHPEQIIFNTSAAMDKILGRK